MQDSKSDYHHPYYAHNELRHNHTYDNVRSQEQMTDSSWKVTVVLHVHYLVRPLGRDPERIFKERGNNEKATNSRNVRFERLSKLVDNIFSL